MPGQLGEASTADTLDAECEVGMFIYTQMPGFGTIMGDFEIPEIRLAVVAHTRSLFNNTHGTGRNAHRIIDRAALTGERAGTSNQFNIHGSGPPFRCRRCRSSAGKR